MASIATQAAPAAVPRKFDKPTLFDVPISNNGARVRHQKKLKDILSRSRLW